MRAAHRAHRRQILLQRRIAEPQLHGAEAAGEQLLRLVGDLLGRHQAEPATVVGGDRLAACRRPGSQAARRRRPPAASHAAMSKPRHRHADDALHADQREALRELAPEIERRDRLALDHLLHHRQHRRDRRHHAAHVAPQIGAAGDALLGLEIDQQQRRLGDDRRGWCRARRSSAPRRRRRGSTRTVRRGAGASCACAPSMRAARPCRRRAA